MKNLTGTEVEANIKVKGAPRPDANSSAVVEHTTNSVSKASKNNEGNTSARRSLSTETGNEEGEAQNDTMQLVKRQECDIIVILQSLETLQKEMKSFQKEMKSVKVAVNDIRARQDEQQTHELAEDIELLTDTISQVSGKVGELDALKLESKMMQSRVKRLEDEKRGLQTGMEPPPTPRLASNGARPAPSFQKAEEKPLSNSTYSPHRSAYTPVVNSALSRSRVAPAQGSHTPRSHARNDMPPPDIPRSASSRALARPSSFRSGSETARNPHGRSNLHNAISDVNDSASELPSAAQDDDDDEEEYNDGESSLDPEDETYQPRRSRSRQSLPARMASVDVAPEGRYKRRRTTSHALTRDNTTPPSPHPDDPNYKSIWAAPTAESERVTPVPVQRNEHGFIIKPNGQVDKRSLRFLGKVKNKRRNVGRDAVRDAEGYLLDADGTRNERSVRIINGMRKREREERGESVES